MTSALLTKCILFAAIIGIAYSVGLYEQCAGEGYGTFPCAPGLGCFRRNKWYSSCQPSCPRNVGWECDVNVAPLATIAVGWDQCGGEGWVGPAVCEAGYACYARSIHYSQCRPINDCPSGWSCGVYVPVTAAPTVPPTTRPVILAPYAQCNGVVGAICPAGTACFRSNELYAECRPSCPSAWICGTDVAGLYQQCGGESYVGLTRCAEGLHCYARSVYYSQCRPINDCPSGWACGVYVPVTAAPTVVPTAAPTVPPTTRPVTLAPYAQCNGVVGAVCPAGTACFRNNELYAECRPSCPHTWICGTDVAGLNEQCGGEGYVGLTRCAEGLRCYARSKWYAQCTASCPGADWAC